jgi:PKD repeat protein
MKGKIILLVALLVVGFFLISPATAQDNPYQRFGEVTKKDVAVNLDSGYAKLSNSSNVKFTDAEYTHTLGRVSIKMKPLLEGIDKNITSKGNVRTSGTKNQIKYLVYKNLIKEEISLNAPKTVRYSYDLWLSDWVTKKIDTSKLQKKREWRGLNKSEIESQFLGNEIIDYARNSTIDIQPDRWGNLVVLVNNKDVVIMPRPYAIDASGKRFDLDYTLDKKNKIIIITGNMSGALYPLTIDPTERVTNGDFETGDFSGWTFSADGEYADTCWADVVFGSNAPYDEDDTYFCWFVVTGVNTTSRISQTVDMIDPATLFFLRDLYGGIEGNPDAMFSVKIGNTTVYSHDCQESRWTSAEENVSGITGPQVLSFELSSFVDDGIDDNDGFVAVDQISVGMTDFSPPTVDFIASPSSGPAPLEVQFTDISAHSPTSWLWDFCDGTDTSTEQNLSHIYEAAGTYDVILTARNYFGSNTEHKEYYITVTEPTAPDADFTASPLTGPAPLTVQFNDTSTGFPTLWSWDFGDGNTSTGQNSSHVYAAVGSYNVSLTVENAVGDDTVTKSGYVTVTGGTVDYYVFADGIDLYYNYQNNPDLSGSDTSAQGFYQHLATAEDRCHLDNSGTNYCWNERSNPVNNDTGSKYWSKTELADSIGANSAEFVFHAGHGWEDGILFGTENTYHHVFRSNMSFSRTKWAAFDSCSMLNASNQQNWSSVFDGLHILMAYETIGLIDENTGPQFVERMKGGTYQAEQYSVTPIRYAWRDTLQDTVHNSTLLGAYMYADQSGDDYLPGYGSFTEPVKTDGHYTTRWGHFQCI